MRTSRSPVRASADAHRKTGVFREALREAIADGDVLRTSRNTYAAPGPDQDRVEDNDASVNAPD
jgi:hypothetical protein